MTFRSVYSEEQGGFRPLDECCFVLNQTPLFMFDKPLALLISNIFSFFFSVLWCAGLCINTWLKRAKWTWREAIEFLPVRMIAPGAIERNCGRTQGVGWNAGPVSPRLTLLP
jgi:hypothetical protein